MRTKIEIKYPAGYPYILYQITDKKARRFVASATEIRARQNSGLTKGKVTPVKILDLIKELGHKKTSELLQEIYPRWVCKDGKVFYKHV